jgi:hypothetical protein
VFEPVLNPGDRNPRRSFSGLNQFTSAAEAIPLNSSNVGRDYQIGLVAPPVFGGALENLEAAVHHLDQIAGLCTNASAGQLHRNHVRGAELPA